jgi:hypothetical protein
VADLASSRFPLRAGRCGVADTVSQGETERTAVGTMSETACGGVVAWRTRREDRRMNTPRTFGTTMGAFADHFWLAWGIALGMLGLIASYLDRSAAMRGTYGQPPPWIVDKLLRLFFFTILVSPTCFRFPWLVLAYVLYLPSYLDGCVPWFCRTMSGVLARLESPPVLGVNRVVGRSATVVARTSGLARGVSGIG